MAEPLTIVSSIITLVTFTLQSSVTLYTAVREFQTQDEDARALQTELADVTNSLLSLLETINSNPDIDFDVLKLPLYRCGKNCEEYSELIRECMSHDTTSRSSFRNWCKQKYLQGDINDVRTMLAGYKSTINIALADANMRIATVTPKVIEEFKDMISVSILDLGGRLEKLDEQVRILATENTKADSGHATTSERHALIEEKESTQQGLKISAQLSAQIEQYEHTFGEETQYSHRSLVNKHINPGSNDTRISIESLVSQLQVHKNNIDRQLEALDSAVPLAEHDASQVTQLRETRSSIRQCIKLLDKSNENVDPNSEWPNIFENITMADDGYDSNSMASLGSTYSSQDQTEESESLEAQVTERRQEVMREIRTGTPSEIRLKALESDSGYASAPRLATLTTPSESDYRGSMDSPAVKPVRESTCSNDDIQSLVSDIDDIGSQESEETTHEKITGKALLRVFLVEETEFRALCEKALVKMSKGRFVENMRRLLKSFHKSLSEEGESEPEKAVAKLLRSRRGRLRISQQIVTHFQQERDETSRSDKVDLRIAPEAKIRVEKWLALASDSPENHQEHTSILKHKVERLGGSESGLSDSDDSHEENALPYTSGLKEFLLKSQSFRILRKEFMLMLLPAELRHVLSSTPKDRIQLSQEQDTSFWNKTKVWVEDYTHVRWNWWPFEPRKRMLQGNESRMFWQCSCGRRQWEDVSDEKHELVTKILALSNNTQSTHWCRGRRLATPLKALLGHMFQKLSPNPSATSPSSAAQRYTPLGNTALASSLKQASSPRRDKSSRSLARSMAIGGSSTANQQTQMAATQNEVDQVKSWILFGVQGTRRALIPVQIPVNSSTTDYSVVQELKKCYQAYRGRLRLWFSIWRMEYCEIVKFHRLTPDRLVREYKDLPTHQDYQYSPRAGSADARNPPISPHAFESLLYACSSPCTWPVSHDCMPPPASVIYLGQIPKRTKEFKTDQVSPIWGFETVFSPSLSHIFVYHCVMVVGPFAFWAWWLIDHPNDMQNASVPATLVLGALSLFWSSAGILTNRRKD